MLGFAGNRCHLQLNAGHPLQAALGFGVLGAMRFDSRFGGFDEKQEATKPSAFDVLTKLVLPALSFTALIVAQLQQRQSALLWGLLGFAFLSLVVGFYPAVRTGSKAWIHNRRAEQQARQRFSEFRKFVRQFGAFVDTGPNDTLHYIVASELCRNNMTDFGKLGIPTIGLFNGFWYHFNLRVEQQGPSLAGLRQAIQEFGNLVGAYDNNCVVVVFERLSHEVQTSLTPQVRSSLNAFQQRFVHFLQGYQQFLKDLVESGLIPRESHTYFSYPKPL